MGPHLAGDYECHLEPSDLINPVKPRPPSGAV